MSFYWDDENFWTEPYSLNSSVYFCGKVLKKPILNKSVLNNLVLIDLQDITTAKVFSDKSFEVVFKNKSFINNKIRAGGQSSQRFQRIRQEQVKAWFKKAVGEIVSFENPLVGINPVYRGLLEGYLPKGFCCGWFVPEYCDVSGVYQFVNGLD